MSLYNHFCFEARNFKDKSGLHRLSWIDKYQGYSDKIVVDKYFPFFRRNEFSLGMQRLAVAVWYDNQGLSIRLLRRCTTDLRRETTVIDPFRIPERKAVVFQLNYNIVSSGEKNAIRSHHNAVTGWKYAGVCIPGGKNNF